MTAKEVNGLAHVMFWQRTGFVHLDVGVLRKSQPCIGQTQSEEDAMGGLDQKILKVPIKSNVIRVKWYRWVNGQ